ncbi:MAG: DNA-protecting protein DprA [Chloroflexi bacterium]|nr:MAG: DNA-protecting protein DprA [Chloroflexota bacterium]
MDVNEARYWVGFSLIPGIGRIRLSLLEAYFGNLERAWHASAGELKATGLDARSTEAIVSLRNGISLEEEVNKLKRYGVAVITSGDAEYPRRLAEIYDYPPVLYVRGTLLPEDEWSLAVVGTRRASVYGRQVAEEIVADLARSKVTVVSGLAKGIDAIAHRAAMQADGRTIAVAGCGLDMVYPSDHVALARQIMEHGALVSEFPLGTRPKAEHFPQRNRIISGMSLGVLVIEAGEKSGALSTAHWAVEQNRDVFAIPGSIFSPASKGTNRLIQEGAKLVNHAADILEELNLTMGARQLEMTDLTAAADTTDTESQLLGYLSREAIHIDDVCRNSGLPIATVSSILAVLELKGLAKQVGSMSYVRT